MSSQGATLVSFYYRAFWTEHVGRLERLWRGWTNDSRRHDRTIATESLSFEFDLHHSPEKVWRALTDPVLLAE
jgi:hypothetical protein